MRDVSDLFVASAASLWGTMTSHSGTAGFRIPDYQRTYDWSEEKIGRLLEDCANGLYYLTQSEESFTFLGTLILVRERTKEPAFDGTSLAVVDGQQRLTTLLLASCALIEAITERLALADGLREGTRQWLNAEAEFQINELFNCGVGQLPGRAQTHPYPRIVRDGDTRGKVPQDREYVSIVSRFLMSFAEYYRERHAAFKHPSISEHDGQEVRFRKNFEFIRREIRHFADPTLHEGTIDYQVLLSSDFQRKGLRSLFEKLDVIEDESEQNRALSEISKGGQVEGLVRLVLLASFLNRCVVLTRVETDDEGSAFDIFDALNTTGEPLTAIETFKPRVIQFEREQGRYSGSESDQAFDVIEQVLDSGFENTDARQRETKELIVSFALYADGSRESKELSHQRRYLRTRFENIASPHDKRRFVRALSDMALFRSRYWHKRGIQALTAYHSVEHAGSLQLCFRFIANMNTSLALPILARYWSHHNRTGDEEQFVGATKALTAFLVLRRAVTGGTGGIDSDFRSVMEKGSDDGNPLCLGLNFENELMPLDQLKHLLRGYLQARRIGVADKQSWVSQVREVPLAQHSATLAKFLIMAAAHHALPDPHNPGLLTREDVRPSDEQEYLTYNNWISDLYKTVEHVAPDANPGSGWDGEIYRRPATRHTIGNLVLLPQKENSSAGNSGWPRKKIFYLALLEKNQSEQERYFEEAKRKGFQFPKKTEQLLRRGYRLHFLKPFENVEDWNEAFIYARSDNLLSLAWDHIAPWLFE